MENIVRSEWIVIGSHCYGQLRIHRHIHVTLSLKPYIHHLIPVNQSYLRTMDWHIHFLFANTYSSIHSILAKRNKYTRYVPDLITCVFIRVIETASNGNKPLNWKCVNFSGIIICLEIISSGLSFRLVATNSLTSKFIKHFIALCMRMK